MSHHTAPGHGPSKVDELSVEVTALKAEVTALKILIAELQTVREHVVMSNTQEAKSQDQSTSQHMSHQPGITEPSAQHYKQGDRSIEETHGKDKQAPHPPTSSSASSSGKGQGCIAPPVPQQLRPIILQEATNKTTAAPTTTARPSLPSQSRAANIERFNVASEEELDRYERKRHHRDAPA